MHSSINSFFHDYKNHSIRRNVSIFAVFTVSNENVTLLSFQLRKACCWSSTFETNSNSRGVQTVVTIFSRYVTASTATPISSVTSVARISPQRSRRRRDISGCDSTVTIASRTRASRPFGVWYQDQPIVSPQYFDSSTRLSRCHSKIFLLETNLFQSRIRWDYSRDTEFEIANYFVASANMLRVYHVPISHGLCIVIFWIRKISISCFSLINFIKVRAHMYTEREKLTKYLYVRIKIVAHSLKTNASDDRRFSD